jgi:GNAT superfamily N-acetyltransferase
VNEPEPGLPLGLVILPARPGDALACAAVMRAAVRAVPRGLVSARARKAWASLPPLYHRWAMGPRGPGGERYLVAWRHGRAVGFAALRHGELTSMFVRPSAQRRGVGRALVGAAAREALRDGRGSLRVLAARSAVPFYAALGFRLRGAARVPLPGGSSLPAARMHLSLRAPAPRGRSRPRGPADRQPIGSTTVTSARKRSTASSRPSRQDPERPR